MRTEQDSIGEVQIPSNCLYGVQSYRARINFPFNSPFHPEWYRALGAVKLACYLTYQKYREALLKKCGDRALLFATIDESTIKVLISAAEEVMQGEHYDQFIVPGLCGGAGTSINMNINEIITNRALQKTENKPGDYGLIDPIHHANVFQSTNDVVPTSLRIAVMDLLDVLEKKIHTLRSSFEALEKKYLGSARIAYTQMQEAVPTTFGRLFSTYNEALSRDWWRVSKSFERIKVVNLGGGAIGTGITVPRYFIFEAVQTLREITGKPVTRSENLTDTTSNLDPLTEVHAILKAHAVNLEKISSDLRILSCDLSVDSGFILPAKQLGSTIMPGKVNPVIPEFVIGCCHRVYANDALTTTLSAQGCLELNPCLPFIGHTLLESLKLLIACDEALDKNLIRGILIDEAKAGERLLKSPSITTALVPYIGYHKATEISLLMKQEDITIYEANGRTNSISGRLLEYILQPSNLLRLGFVPSQIIDEMHILKHENDDMEE
jgi:aspartate ammonia-lyase